MAPVIAENHSIRARCYSSVAIATVDVWLLPWRQVDPFLRGSLADLEDHLCQTFPAAQGLPVYKNKQDLFARITNQFTAIRYSCSGFGLGVQSFLFYAKIRTWAKLLSIYLSRADFDVCSIPWKNSWGNIHEKLQHVFFFFLASCINFLTDFPDLIQFETVRTAMHHSMCTRGKWGLWEERTRKKLFWIKHFESLRRQIKNKEMRRKENQNLKLLK